MKYRMLDLYETVEEGDETCDQLGWWHKCEATIGGKVTMLSAGKYRRPIPDVPSGTSEPEKPFQWHIEANVVKAGTLSTQVGGSHYSSMAIQPVEFITKNGLTYLEGNVVKYLSRHRRKNGKEDLLKAKHYLEMLIEMEYGPDKK